MIELGELNEPAQNLKWLKAIKAKIPYLNKKGLIKIANDEFTTVYTDKDAEKTIRKELMKEINDMIKEEEEYIFDAFFGDK